MLWPKIQNQTDLFFPTHPICHQGSHIVHLGPWGAVSDPQTAVNTPKTTPSPQWLSLWVISKSLGEKSKIKPFFFATHAICHQGSHIAQLAHWTPQTTINTPKTIPYSIASLIVGNIRKPQPIIQDWTVSFFPTLLICHKGSHIAHLGLMGALSGPPNSRTCP